MDGQIQSSGRVRELESHTDSSTKDGVTRKKMDALLKLSQQSPQESIVPMTNARCQLLHWYMFEEEKVAVEGKIATTDQSAKVHHLPLGWDCWKV